MNIVERLKDSLEYEYNLSFNDRKHLLEEIDRLNKEYERIYNENCKLREEHNITDIKLLDENNRLNNIIDELEKYLNQEIIEWQDASDLWTKAQVQEDRIVLDKLKTLKENNK